MRTAGPPGTPVPLRVGSGARCPTGPRRGSVELLVPTGAARPWENGSTTTVQTVRRHPISAFAVLACFFGWMPYIVTALGIGERSENSPSAP